MATEEKVYTHILRQWGIGDSVLYKPSAFVKQT